MSVVEVDLFLQIQTGHYDLRMEDLRRAIHTRLDLERPVIVEGAFVLRTLRDLDLRHETLVFVRRVPPNTNRLEGMDEYLSQFSPEKHADYVFEWKDPWIAS